MPDQCYWVAVKDSWGWFYDVFFVDHALYPPSPLLYNNYRMVYYHTVCDTCSMIYMQSVCIRVQNRHILYMQVMIFPDTSSIFQLDHLALSTFLAVVMANLLKFNKEVKLVDPFLCQAAHLLLYLWSRYSTCIWFIATNQISYFCVASFTRIRTKFTEIVAMKYFIFCYSPHHVEFHNFSTISTLSWPHILLQIKWYLSFRQISLYFVKCVVLGW